MSRRQLESVPNYADLVEDYTKTYPQTERKALKKLILLNHPQLNPRSLNRHLKKAFESKVKLDVHASKQLNKRLEDQNQEWYSAPKIPFFITEKILGHPLLKRQLPSVGFNIISSNNYPLRVRIEARTILGGRNLGLIQDIKGYYNGETEIGLEPGEGFANGSFSVPEECVKSNEELSIEVRVTAIYQDNREYKLFPKSWTYKRDENIWFYEPREFTDGK
jgi:hypothetical protein